MVRRSVDAVRWAAEGFFHVWARDAANRRHYHTLALALSRLTQAHESTREGTTHIMAKEMDTHHTDIDPTRHP